MASDLSFVQYVCDQIGGAGPVTFRKMFGEYAIYLDGKVVVLVCDNQMFLKPTTAGKELLGEVEEAPPYNGAKNSYLIGDQLEDRELMAAVVTATATELPAPKPKKPKAARKK